MQKINVNFENPAGQALAGILDRPLAEPRAYALFAHCFTCSKNLKAATNVSRALTEAGFAVLRFDFTGLGQSEGEFGATTFSSNVDDLLAAARFLEQDYEAPAVLVGHSLGGTAVLQAARDIPSAAAVATIGSPADPAHVKHLFAGSRDEMADRGYAEVSLGGRSFTMRRQFLDDLGQHDLPASVGGLRKALLVMHAPLDDTVELDNASALFAAAKHPKSFVSLDTADHLLTREEDSRYAGHVLAAWSSRYLPPAADERSLPAEGDAAARTFGGGFRTDVRIGAHSLTADEPAAAGGTGAGPSPYGLLSAALAACTSMTLRMYADFKKLDLRSAMTSVTHDKVHADDCADCESSTGKVDEFQRVITLDGDLTDDQRQRMLEIADRCPVHKTLHGEVRVRTRLAGDA